MNQQHGNFAKNRWWPLHQELEIDTWAGHVYVPRPTTQTLDDFGAWAGFKLPPSYRDFVLLFGPGELAGWYRILAPVGLKKARQDLAAFHSDWLKETRRHDFGQWWHNPERMKRVVFFCDTFGAEYFAWDPQDSSRTEPEEYRVHLHYKRGDEPGTHWEVVADSFVGFVRDYCFSHSPKASPDYVSDDDASIKHPFIFQPQVLKGKPGWRRRKWVETRCGRWRDVKESLPRGLSVDPAWLAWNDEAALKMAYHVFEGDHFELMPVLADALEEAGCADEPILQHLRSGGWHLRNCWVLKSLFEAETATKEQRRTKRCT